MGPKSQNFHTLLSFWKKPRRILIRIGTGLQNTKVSVVRDSIVYSIVRDSIFLEKVHRIDLGYENTFSQSHGVVAGFPVIPIEPLTVKSSTLLHDELKTSVADIHKDFERKTRNGFRNSCRSRPTAHSTYVSSSAQ